MQGGEMYDRIGFLAKVAVGVMIVSVGVAIWYVLRALQDMGV